MENMIIQKPDIERLKRQIEIVCLVVKGAAILSDEAAELEGLVNFCEHVTDSADKAFPFPTAPATGTWS